MDGSKLDELASDARKAIGRIAKVITGLEDNFVFPVLDLTKQLGKAVEEIEKPVKERVKKLLLSSGHEFTEAGSRELVIAGWREEIRPGGGGFNGDRLAALMKSIGVERIQYCDVEKVYTPSEKKIKRLIKEKKLTKKQVKACRNEVTWAVQTPTKVKTDE